MLEGEWLRNLQGEFCKPYYKELYNRVCYEYENYIIYPPVDKLYRALECTPLENVKVVILGQDPYHGEGQANGLAFSVSEGCDIPPSLNNIFKEIIREYKIPANSMIRPKNGDLTEWANQGVLLLNTSLMVRKDCAGSLTNIGWNTFTQKILEIVNMKNTPVVFMLWGKHAIDIKNNINFNSKHLILESSHPSPLSVNKGFNECGHFKKCNEFLIKNKECPINWIKNWY